ncbi:MAG: helix-turn-helix transcriptional regulator [Tissierellia bacterium]|nr:helix-turn-helix transcriptional regulator [Tissierellia bacterium]
MSFGKQLAKILAEKGTNANELSKKIGVPASTIYSMINRNSKRTDVDILVKIADALDMTIDELLGVTSKQTPQTIAAHSDHDLSEEEQEKVRDYIAFLISQKK